MCIICECERFGLSYDALTMAANYAAITEGMDYCIAYAASKANATAEDFSNYQASMERALSNLGVIQHASRMSLLERDALERTLREIGEYDQEKWKEVVATLLRVRVDFAIMYSRYGVPLHIVEAVLSAAAESDEGVEITIN